MESYIVWKHDLFTKLLMLALSGIIIHGQMLRFVLYSVSMWDVIGLRQGQTGLSFMAVSEEFEIFGLSMTK